MVPSAASALFRSLDGYAIYGNFFSRHDEVYGWYPLLLPLGEQRELVLCPIRPAGRQSRCPKRFCSHSATKITKNLAKRRPGSKRLVLCVFDLLRSHAVLRCDLNFDVSAKNTCWVGCNALSG